MSKYDNELKNKAATSQELENTDDQRQRRRRLLTSLGVGLVGAYVAPTLFSVGQAQAWHSSYSRPSSFRYSYSRPSRYDHYRRERSRLREYNDDPLLILEDVILGTRRR